MNEFDELFEEYLNFQSLMHKYFAWKRKEKGIHGNPHRGQGRILRILKLQPEITQKELTFLLDMRPQSLGELLTKLEKAELITRTPSQEDRRVMVIRLTPAGQQEAEKIKQPQEDTLFDILTDEEKEQFQKILVKLSNHIDKELPEEMKQAFYKKGSPNFPHFGGGFGHGHSGHGPFGGGHHHHRHFHDFDCKRHRHNNHSHDLDSAFTEF